MRGSDGGRRRDRGRSTGPAGARRPRHRSASSSAAAPRGSSACRTSRRRARERGTARDELRTYVYPLGPAADRRQAARGGSGRARGGGGGSPARVRAKQRERHGGQRRRSAPRPGRLGARRGGARRRPPRSRAASDRKACTSSCAELALGRGELEARTAAPGIGVASVVRAAVDRAPTPASRRSSPSGRGARRRRRARSMGCCAVTRRSRCRSVGRGSAPWPCEPRRSGRSWRLSDAR